MSIEWFPPWEAAQDSSFFERELVYELPKGHVLFGEPFRLLGRRVDRDDFLFQLEGGRVASVHLTWSRETDPAWPSTTIFANLAEWHQQQMLPEICEWRAEENGSFPPHSGRRRLQSATLKADSRLRSACGRLMAW